MRDDNKNKSPGTLRTGAVFVILFFSGAGAPFVDITDLSLVESIEVGPTDTGGFMATGTSIISSKKALCSPAITTPTPDNSQSRMFRNAEVMEQCGISLPH